jgi:hypothetical protein
VSFTTTTSEQEEPREVTTILDIEEFGEDYFIPLMPIPHDMWRSMYFLKLWKKYMTVFPDSSYSPYWAPMLAHTLTPCKAADALYASRVAASFAAWLGRNNGFSFAHILFEKLTKEKISGDDYHNIHKAITLWSFENSLYNHQNLGGGRTLHSILGYRATVILKAIEFDTVEKIIVWLASQDGIAYLTEAISFSGRIEARKWKKWS